MAGNWDESEHPRDNEGKFTYKNGGESSCVSTTNSVSREDILYPTMKDTKPKLNKEKIILGNYKNENLLREDILYPSMNSNRDDGVLTGGAGSVITDEIAGIKKGEPISIEDAVKGTNPNYDPFGNPTYKVNCQACVAINEARMRGYDIEVNIDLESDIKNKLSERPNIAYIDPKTGKTPEFTKSKVQNETECINWLDNSINQGERYIFAFQWRGKDYNNRDIAHIMTVTKDKSNKLKFYDPQIGKTRNPEFLGRIQYKFDWKEEAFPPKILRVDDKELNSKIMNKISKPSRKKSSY